MTAKNLPFGNDLDDLWTKPRRRPARVADTIRSEIALLLLRKIKDPRLESLTVTRVSVTDDLRTARVYYSVFDAATADKAAEGLQKASGFIRSHLAKSLAMRYVPKLIFLFDENLAHQEKMERLFHEIEDEDESPTG